MVHIKMIDWLIRQLFKWNNFRSAVFEEVDWQNSIGLILNDPQDMSIATCMWYETDGWKGWTIENNVYYFNDIPEKSLSDLMGVLNERNGI